MLTSWISVCFTGGMSIFQYKSAEEQVKGSTLKDYISNANESALNAIVRNRSSV